MHSRNIITISIAPGYPILIFCISETLSQTSSVLAEDQLPSLPQGPPDHFWRHARSDSVHHVRLDQFRQISWRAIFWSSNQHRPIKPLVDRLAGCFRQQYAGVACRQVDLTGALPPEVFRTDRSSATWPGSQYSAVRGVLDFVRPPVHESGQPLLRGRVALRDGSHQGLGHHPVLD